MSQATFVQTDLQALLTRWVELEPECCMMRSNVSFGVRSPRLGLNFIEAWADDSMPMVTGQSFMRLQAVVQDCIVNAGLIYSLNNTPEGQHSGMICQIGSSKYASGEDKEPAIALLKAYVSWLEQKAAVSEIEDCSNSRQDSVVALTGREARPAGATSRLMNSKGSSEAVEGEP